MDTRIEPPIHKNVLAFLWFAKEQIFAFDNAWWPAQTSLQKDYIQIKKGQVSYNKHMQAFNRGAPPLAKKLIMFMRCVCVCVCVCERERERERWAGYMCLFFTDSFSLTDYTTLPKGCLDGFTACQPLSGYLMLNSLFLFLLLYVFKYVFTHTLHTGSMWHNVNFSFEFRVWIQSFSSSRLVA